MAQTQITSAMIKDGDVKRADLNTATSGSAVITKVVAGTGVTLSSTGADAGTGDVTINASGGGTPQDIRCFDFANTVRIANGTSNSGVVANVSSSQAYFSVQATTGTNSTAWGQVSFTKGSGWDLGASQFTANTHVLFTAFMPGGSDFEFFLGMTNSGTVSTTAIYTGLSTTRHIGFKADRTGSGTTHYYATSGDGSAATATSITPTHPGSLTKWSYFIDSSASSLKFYQLKTLVATITTNIPSDAFTTDSYCVIQVNNKGTANNSGSAGISQFTLAEDSY